MDHLPGLVWQYDVICAPTLVLLDAEGQAAWRQEEGLSDEMPLDLDQVKGQFEALKMNQ